MSAEKDPDRDPPDPVKREVRQRCGFGCVLCGLPLYEYEHMEGWVNVRNRPKGQQHIASEITLLCDTHHREKTNGLLPIAKVRAADAAPFNRQRGVSKPYDLHYEGDSCEIVVGGNSFAKNRITGTQLAAVAIDGETLLGFTFDQDHLFLTLRHYGDDGRLILRIEQNTLVYSVTPWDITLQGRNLVIRAGHGQFLLDILFDPPNRVTVSRGRLQKQGLQLLIWPNQVCYANIKASWTGSRSLNADVGILIGQAPAYTRSAAWGFEVANRYLVDRQEVERWMRDVARQNQRSENESAGG
jgi:trigger factor